MTDSELSLKIAEHLEPKPNGRGSESVWTYCQVALSRGAEVIEPRDMVNDPAMTVMLMKRPEFVRAQLFLDSFTKANMYFVEFKDPIRQCEHKDLGRAVAAAFARAKGLQ